MERSEFNRVVARLSRPTLRFLAFQHSLRLEAEANNFSRLDKLPLVVDANGDFTLKYRIEESQSTKVLDLFVPVGGRVEQVKFESLNGKKIDGELNMDKHGDYQVILNHSAPFTVTVSGPRSPVLDKRASLLCLHRHLCKLSKDTQRQLLDSSSKLPATAEKFVADLFHLRRTIPAFKMVSLVRNWIRDNSYYIRLKDGPEEGETLSERLGRMACPEFISETCNAIGSRNFFSFTTPSFIGTCKNFAELHAVMLRRLGIPAGIASGFKTNFWQRTITEDHLHAQTAVLLPHENGLWMYYSDATQDGRPLTQRRIQKPLQRFVPVPPAEIIENPELALAQLPSIEKIVDPEVDSKLVWGDDPVTTLLGTLYFDPGVMSSIGTPNFEKEVLRGMPFGRDIWRRLGEPGNIPALRTLIAAVSQKTGLQPNVIRESFQMAINIAAAQTGPRFAEYALQVLARV